MNKIKFIKLLKMFKDGVDLAEADLKLLLDHSSELTFETKVDILEAYSDHLLALNETKTKSNKDERNLRFARGI